ncbi:hypothetical protein NG799_02125 [Laspinema sp. D1]|uniref:Uncharacterized protein n=2 Tax=Laspinema TaxID=2584823 RepID=A0ABT2MM99_9CYAN|nr:hypothetical protein [Laspinema sp. D3b]MCT7965130.1 hypothetical protein [Laspinema sp. D2a]MCT7977567.1 hypothetical protein [Laspinema sp. D3b]
MTYFTADEAFVQLIEILYDKGKFPEYQSLEICVAEVLSGFLEKERVQHIIQQIFSLNVEIPDDVAKKVGVDSVDDVPVPDVVVEKKVCAFRFSDFDLDEDELPELANFKDSKELNDFLDKDDEESVALRVKIFQLGLKALRKDGDAYSTAIEIFTE